LVERQQSTLLKIAGLFLTIFAIILSLAPAVRERTWDVTYRWNHWVGLLTWAAIFTIAHHATKRYIPDRDPYLLPIAALLSGWGLLTIWRLTPTFGLRQTIWIAAAVGLFSLSLRFPLDLDIVRRYKYILLTGGLLLTSLTLIFGSNPAGTGPRLWLGCCGIYLQPSEPLKLLLVSYLAAYLADRLPARDRLVPLLFPTLFVTGLALLLLIVQRDLGTASIFILLYATIVYIAIGRKRVLLISAGMLLLAGLAGYYLISLIQLRVDAWLNPWVDPSGRAYQIVQSLLAIANGGLFGRGPGLGSPGLVPISHSDFIFTAIAEETGLVGVVGLLVLLALLISRGLRIALLAPGRFRRLLATGITTYFGIQSLLIIGGNLRVLPLTGVTLPFVSYGGSSLLTSFVALLALLLISNQSIEEEPAPLQWPAPYYLVNGVIALGLVTMSLGTGWWTLARGTDLLNRTDNARRSISDRYVKRGSLVDRDNTPINITQGETGGLSRYYVVPELAPIIGYTHPVFGQAGLEASLDDYLRGLQGNPASLIWWDRLLYGTPPPGLDVRLSLDLSLQSQADQLLGEHKGAILLLNARTGEILVMASHPGYNPNLLDDLGDELSSDKDAPLLNRATLGRYPPDSALEPFSQALFGRTFITVAQRIELYQRLGFDLPPRARIPAGEANSLGENMRVSPLQMALATAAMSNDGVRPPARIAVAVKTPQQGWVVLPALDKPVEILPESDVHEITQALAGENPYWSFTGAGDDTPLTWYLAGTLPDWSGTPLSLAILLEEDNSNLAEEIGKELLDTALQP
jgi:cell division protein FtsW (lipid II flippase)